MSFLRILYFSILLIISSLIFFLISLNVFSVTHPNDGILYYSIALNFIENYSLSSGLFADDNVYTPQIGVSVVIAIFLLFFGKFWPIAFGIFIIFIWFFSIKILSKTLSETLFKDLKIFNDSLTIQIFILIFLFSSIYLVRISTSFYNEALYIPLQIYLLSKFLLISHDKESLNLKNKLILLFSFFGVLLRVQHLIFIFPLYFYLFFLKRVGIYFVLFLSFLVATFILAIFINQNNLHFNLDFYNDLSFYKAFPERIFLAFNSFGIVFNLYFISSQNILFSSVIIGSLLFILFKGFKTIYKTNLNFSFLLIFIILGNIFFVSFLIPLNFIYDDYVRFYWPQYVPMLILLIAGLDNVLFKYKFSIKVVLILVFFLASFLFIVFNKSLIDSFNKRFIYSNDFFEVRQLINDWDLKDKKIITEDLKREIFWEFSLPTYNLSYINKKNCIKNESYFLISKKEMPRYDEIDKKGDVKLYKVCK
tara:strand:- start:162 stop:1595 length:1434 start_codon:yes stop_codon:yes gene_type:complete